ncbi:MAG: DEAD/DEAH box helicase, partial [Duncaniella sp.]|nr:DEAD/DEAH box helicase [Duncaniella sp.]
MKQKEILSNIFSRTQVTALNPMQQQMAAIPLTGTFVLLAPTGSGKTLAFTIPALEKIDPDLPQVQVLCLAPTRELAVQISGEVDKLSL